ncbi:unnamed protein product [Closterium sp. Naga37s-1]|nr:unnamed protein product [Closterium sp. Naga37s-1]
MVTAADSDQSDSQSEQLKDSPCPALTNGEPSSAAVESVSISDSEAHCSADVAAVGIGTAAAAEKVAAADEGAESVAQSAGSQEAEGGVESAEAGDAVSGVTGGAGPGAMVEPENEAQAADRERLPEILMEGSDLLVDPEKALTDGFLAVHDAALEETSFNCNISGTTAVVAHLYKQRLAVAWVGDSRAVLARRREGGERDDLMAVRLSADHKPNNDEERARIEASEGSVQQDVDENGDDVGPFRVWMKTGPMLGLAMSRSLGDKLAHTVGVSATPEVVVRRLDQSDAFLVLGSDGLWEYVGDDEAIGVVVAAGSIEAGVKALLALAKERWLTKDGAGYVDDITALVVGFTHRKV